MKTILIGLLFASLLIGCVQQGKPSPSPTPTVTPTVEPTLQTVPTAEPTLEAVDTASADAGVDTAIQDAEELEVISSEADAGEIDATDLDVAG